MQPTNENSSNSTSIFVLLLLTALSFSDAFNPHHVIGDSSEVVVGAIPNVNATYTGVWASIQVPSAVTSSMSGEMISWQIETYDSSGSASNLIALFLRDSPEYFLQASFVVHDQLVATKVQVNETSKISVFMDRDAISGAWNVGMDVDGITYQKTTSYNFPAQTTAGFFMIGQNLQSCQVYPSSNSISFTDVKFRTENEQITPSTKWTRGVSGAECDETVKVSDGTVQFLWNSKM